MTTPEATSLPVGNIEIESGVNNTLVADVVDWSGQVIQWKRNKSRPTQRWRLIPAVDGSYTIMHRAYDALAASGDWGLAIEPPESGKAAQQWRVIPLNVYEIANRSDSASRLVSATHQEAPNHPRVILYEGSGHTNQQWLLLSPPTTGSEYISAGDIIVQNVGVYRERVLDVDWQGALIHWTKDQTRPTQQWQLTPIAGEESYCHIRNSNGTALAFTWDLVLEPPDPIRVNQQWIVAPTIVYRIVNQQTGLDLSVYTERPYDNEPIVQHAYDQRPNQHWKFVTID